MKLRSVSVLYFSPAGSTRRVARAPAAAGAAVRDLDITDKRTREEPLMHTYQTFHPW